MRLKEFTSVECKRIEIREDYIFLLDEWASDIIVSDYMLLSFDGMKALTKPYRESGLLEAVRRYV